MVSIGPPDRVTANQIWLGRVSDPTERGYYRADELTFAQLAQFIRKITIGDATRDSDDYISSWIMGDFSGGGQRWRLNEGADAARFWTAFMETTSPNRNVLRPLVTKVRPNSNCTTCWPLGVGNDGVMYHAFDESSTPKVWGFNESTGDFDYNSGTGVTMTHDPVGKAVAFDGALYVPQGSNGYARVTGSSGTPTVDVVTGSADPTTADPTTTPRPVCFAIFHQRLYCVTTGGGIAYHTLTQKAADADAWHWPHGITTTDFPKIESGATPHRLVVYPDRNGVESLYVVTDKGAFIYDDNNPQWLETHIDFPPHPDAGTAARVWPPGGDLHMACGMADVKYTTAFVVDPLGGPARDHGLPQELRGSIVDLDATIDRLFALVGGILDVPSGYAYNDTVGSAGTSDGQFANVRGLSVDSSGNVFACDEENERVQEFTSSLTFSAKFGSAGTGNGEFATDDGPWDCAHDEDDNLFVVDRGNSRVQKFTAANVYASQFGSFDDGTAAVAGSSTWTLQGSHGSSGSGDDNFDTPGQVAVDSSGNVYVADTGNDRLIKRDSSGTFVDEITSLTGITGVAVDSSGNVYVLYNVDSGVDITGHLTKYNSSLTEQWDEVLGVTDRAGGHLAATTSSVFRVDRARDDVTQYAASDGDLVDTWGGTGTGNGQFDTPHGIATDGTHIWVVDSGNNRVQQFTTAGAYVSQFTVPAGSKGITIDSAGRLLVANSTDGKVYRYDSSGSLIDSFTQSGATGIVADEATIWVTDGTNDTLEEWQDVVVSGSPAAPPDDGKFNLPQAIAIKQSSGRIYVCDTGNHRVQYFTSAGVYEGTIGNTAFDSSTGAITSSSADGTFNTPTGIAVNQDTGAVYVVDQGNDRVQQFTATGTFVRTWGSTGTADGQFTTPTVLAINPATGNVFVADSGRDDVQEFTSGGAFVRTLGASGTSNGQFQEPSGIAFASDGDPIFVADATNEDVQAFVSLTSGALTALPSLHQATGTGWHGVWKGDDPSVVPTWLSVGNATNGYRLWWGADDGFAYHLKLRRTFHNPAEGFLAGIDEFATSSVLETGRFDAAMSGFAKIGSHLIVYMDSATADETLTVEVAIDGGGYQTLGTVSSTGRTALPFNVVDGFSKGVQFNDIQLRYTMARGSNKLLTPVWDSATLHFTKIPQNTTSFQFSVPLTDYQGRTAFEQYNDLTNLVTAGEFLPLVHRRDSVDSDENAVSATFRVLIAAISGAQDTGETGTGRADLSIIAIPDGTEV